MDYAKMDIVNLRKLYESNGKKEELQDLIRSVLTRYDSFDEDVLYEFLDGLEIPAEFISDFDNYTIYLAEKLLKLLLENKNEPRALIQSEIIYYLDPDELVNYINYGLIDVDRVIEKIDNISIIGRDEIIAIFENVDLTFGQAEKIFLEIIKRLRTTKYDASYLVKLLSYLEKYSEDENLIDMFFDAMCSHTIKNNLGARDVCLTYIGCELISIGASIQSQNADIYYQSILDKILSNYVIYKTLQCAVSRSLVVSKDSLEGNALIIIDNLKNWLIEQIKIGKVTDIAYIYKVGLLIGYEEEILNYFISIGNLELYELYRNYFASCHIYNNYLTEKATDNKHREIIGKLLCSYDDESPKRTLDKKDAN